MKRRHIRCTQIFADCFDFICFYLRRSAFSALSAFYLQNIIGSTGFQGALALQTRRIANPAGCRELSGWIRNPPGVSPPEIQKNHIIFHALVAFHSCEPSPFFASKFGCAKIHQITYQFARVAQWIERLPPEQEVTGSNPVAGTFSPRARARGIFLRQDRREWASNRS